MPPRGCDVLFHTAAIFAYHGWTPQQLNSVAVQGTLHALEAAHRQGLKRVVVTSSSVVLGSSIQPVAATSGVTCRRPAPRLTAGPSWPRSRRRLARAAELGMPLVAVCPTICIGPHDTSLSPSNAVITSYLADPFRMTFPGGCNIVSARDVAAGHILAAERGEPGARYVLGSENLEWSSIHRIISELCGLDGPRIRANHTASYLVATGTELMAWLAARRPRSPCAGEDDRPVLLVSPRPGGRPRLCARPARRCLPRPYRGWWRAPTSPIPCAAH